MKLAKLSMPRLPVRGSRRSSGSGIGSHSRICSALTPIAISAGNRSLVMPISFRYASAPNAISVACCAFHPNRPTRRSPVPMSTIRAARPLMPSRLRSNGSSSCSSVSSSIASTSPEPKSGIGTRLLITLASTGIAG